MNLERRQYVRFQDNKSLVIELYLGTPESTEKKVIHGLMINESLGGCKIVIVSQLLFPVNTHCLIKFQGMKLNPISAKVAWISEIEPTVFLVGLDYLVNL